MGRDADSLVSIPCPCLVSPARGQSRGGRADKTRGLYFRERERAGNAERLLFFSQYALQLLLSPHLPLTAASEVLPVEYGGEQHTAVPCRVYSAGRTAAVQGAPRRMKGFSGRAAAALLSRTLRTAPHHPVAVPPGLFSSSPQLYSDQGLHFQ